jgi:hypothetical protein
VEVCQGSGAAAVVLDSSVTEDAGEYRIGKLKPGAAYEMRVRLDGRVISAHPASQQVRWCWICLLYLLICCSCLCSSPVQLHIACYCKGSAVFLYNFMDQSAAAAAKRGLPLMYPCLKMNGNMHVSLT